MGLEGPVAVQHVRDLVGLLAGPVEGHVVEEVDGADELALVELEAQGDDAGGPSSRVGLAWAMAQGMRGPR